MSDSVFGSRPPLIPADVWTGMIKYATDWSGGTPKLKPEAWMVNRDMERLIGIVEQEIDKKVASATPSDPAAMALKADLTTIQVKDTAAKVGKGVMAVIVVVVCCIVAFIVVKYVLPLVIPQQKGGGGGPPMGGGGMAFK